MAKKKYNGHRGGFHITHWNKILFVIRLTSLFLIFLAVLLNPLAVKYLLGKEDMFSSKTIMLIYKVEMILFLAGFLIWALQRYYLAKCSDRAKEITLNIIFSMLFFLILLMLSEASVRIFYPQKTSTQIISSSPAVFEEGKFISWQFKPNSTGRMVTGEFNVSYKINSFGMRDIERDIVKKNGIKRILVLGDSFTEGVGVEQNQTYPSMLEKIMNEKNNATRFEVWNAGVGGYAPDTEYVYLKNNIGKIKPDMVMVGFYAGNDVLDLSKNSWKTDESGLPVSVKSDITYVKDGKSRLIYGNPNSYIITFRRYMDIIFSRWSHMYIFIMQKIVGAGHGDFESINLMKVDQTKTIEDNWIKTKMLLNAMKNISESNNAPYIMVIIPSKLQVNDKEWQFAEKKFGEGKLRRDAVQAELMSWCKSTNTSCIDLLSEFNGSKEQMYHTITDMHFNALGHLRTAQIISERLI